MAPPIIHWRLLLRVKDRIKADRQVEKVHRLFARDIEVTASERYWKDETLWDCGLKIAGDSGSAAEVAFDCLVLANRLGNGWHILGPGGAGEMVVFEGVFDAHQSGRPYLAGLEWASFSLSGAAIDA